MSIEETRVSTGPLDLLQDRLRPALEAARFSLIDRYIPEEGPGWLDFRGPAAAGPLLLSLSYTPEDHLLRVELWRPAAAGRAIAVLWQAEWCAPSLDDALSGIAEAITAQLSPPDS